MRFPVLSQCLATRQVRINSSVPENVGTVRRVYILLEQFIDARIQINGRSPPKGVFL